MLIKCILRRVTKRGKDLFVIPKCILLTFLTAIYFKLNMNETNIKAFHQRNPIMDGRLDYFHYQTDLEAISLTLFNSRNIGQHHDFMEITGFLFKIY